MTHKEARQEAQRRADSTGFDHWVHGPDAFGDYSFGMLPRRENRQGRELRDEVVHCTDLSRCQPGHGPTARDRARRRVGNLQPGEQLNGLKRGRS